MGILKKLFGDEIEDEDAFHYPQNDYVNHHITPYTLQELESLLFDYYNKCLCDHCLLKHGRELQVGYLKLLKTVEMLIRDRGV